MGKNQIRLLAMFIFVIMLTACSKKESELPYVEVDLSVTPEQADVGEMVTIEAKVTYGDEVVTDADEVSFEIWRAHDEEHEKIEIEHAGEGNYRLEKTFEQEGTYYVISHVTARDMHNMPKREFVIGEASEPEETPSSSHMNHEDSEEDHSGEH
ncbi:FixH family protein [Robertmurraya massiliosenegalensis]|uniref:FixH family protein n=1 Tax=Robertmurraya TaxID=2837507 RepID=UPI0039A6CB1A